MKRYVFVCAIIISVTACYQSTLKLQAQDKPRIAIIGAGFAGLTTAYHLMQHGYNVHVYEARARVGGRVFSVIMHDAHGNESAAELGAQNIGDGGDAINLRSLASELGLIIEETPWPLGKLGFIDGKDITYPETECAAYSFTPHSLWNCLASLSMQAQTMDDVVRTFFTGNNNLYTLFTALLEWYEGGNTSQLSPVYIKTLYAQIMGRLTDPNNRIATMLTIQGGNGKLAEALAESLGSCVHLNHQVTAITKHESGTFTVHFGNKTSIQSDVVVMAVPCSVYNDISFDTNVIPKERLNAIEQVPYGGNAKVLIPTTDTKNNISYTNGRAASWKVKPHDAVTLFYRKPYGCFDQESLEQMIEQDSILVHMAYDIAPPMQKACVARDESFGVYYGPVGHSWPCDPFAKGSYSFIGAGQEELFMAHHIYKGEPVRSLFAPIDNLFFVGEHTTMLLDVLGTMEAAVESGERITRIIDKTFSAF